MTENDIFIWNDKKTLEKYSKTLYKDGVVVVPFLTKKGSEKWNKMFLEMISEFPEFKKNPDKYVLGGFGALGNTSSFHHPIVREYRRMIKEHFSKPFFKKYEKYRNKKDNLKPRNVELMYDRIAIRSKKQGKPTAESWHRDVFENDPSYGILEDSDTIFGGWINLNEQSLEPKDKRDQYFVAVKKTHRGKDAKKARKCGGGFSAIPKDKHDLLKEKFKKQGSILIKSGSIIIFPQQIAHSVKSGTQPEEPSFRLFLGHRLTNSNEPLFKNQMDVINNQSLPQIPSGQYPPMYSKSHINFHIEKMISPWSKDFNPKLLNKKVKGSNTKNPGFKYKAPDRFLKSLKEYDMMFPEYTENDIKVLQPESVL